MRKLYSEHSRANLLAMALLAATVLICFYPLVLHPTDVIVGPQSAGENDLTNYYIPSRTFFRNSILQDGRFNFWNPWLSLGTAYVGNPQSAVYYPPNWLTLIANPSWSLSWLQLLHHWWMGLGVYYLCRSLSLSWSSSLFGGIVMSVAPFAIAQGAEGHFAQIAASSWMPWAFLALQGYLSKPNAKSGLGVAFCLAMSFLCNHPQETYYLVMAVSGCAVAEACRNAIQSEKVQARQIITGWFGVGFLTFGLVAIDLIPIYFNSKTTPRGMSAISPALMGWDAYNLNHLWQLVAPFSIDRPETWERGTPPFWEKIGYFGIIPLVLAFVAIIVGKSRRLVPTFAILVLITLLIGMGTNGVLFPLMLKIVPGTSWFRLPSRIFFLTSLAIAFLAANGFHLINSDDLAVRRRSRLLASVICLLVLIPIVIHFSRTVESFAFAPLFRQSLIAFPLIAGLAISGIGIWKLKDKTCLSTVLTFLVLGELFCFTNNVIDTASVPPLNVRNPELFEALNTERQESRLQRVLSLQQVLGDQDAIELQIPKLRGYDPTGSIFYLTALNALSQSPDRMIDPTGFSQVQVAATHSNYLSAIGVSHIAQIHHRNYLTFPDHWETLWEGQIAKRIQPRKHKISTDYMGMLIHNPDVLPAAYIVGNAHKLEKGQPLQNVVNGVDFKSTVILERDLIDSESRAPFQAVELNRIDPDHLKMEFEIGAPGYLVVNELWFPGWRATLDGTPVPILRGNLSCRTLQIPPGKHTVIMSFEPQGFKIGLILTTLSLCFSAWVLLQPQTPSQER